MLGFHIQCPEGMRIMMFQLSGFYLINTKVIIWEVLHGEEGFQAPIVSAVR